MLSVDQLPDYRFWQLPISKYSYPFFYDTHRPGLRIRDLPWQLFAVFGGTDGGKAARAAAGGLLRRLDHLPGVLPDCAPAGISVGALAGDVSACARASPGVYSRGFHAAPSGSVKAVPPYRLFALSNFGSLLALVAYPALIEPHSSLHEQTLVWAGGFVLFVIACVIVLWRGRNHGPETAKQEVLDEPAAAGNADSKPAGGQYMLWVLLAACGSVLLCAVTNHLSQNIVAIPLLWILPLIAYLLSFVLVFNGKFYPRHIVLGLAAVALGSIAYMLYWDIDPVHWGLPVKVAVPFLCISLLVLCVFCHGELYRLRPGALHATSFYLCIAAGGAIGSFLVGVLAPLIFSGNYEFVYSLLLTSILGLIVTWRLGLLWRGGCAAAIVLMAGLSVGVTRSYHKNVIAQMRSFYGSLRVTEERVPPHVGLTRTLYHGTIEHGSQIFTDKSRTEPTTYYGHDSGIGLALDNCCDGRPRRVGVIGLGTGTIAVYGRAGDVFRFYDINPQVERIARSLFSYTRESKAQVEIVMGDARLSMAQEPPQNYDVIAIDAFTGDAVPVHLLTAQAFELYRRHLRPGGVLAFHISSQYLNLEPLIKQQADHARLNAVLISSEDDDNGIDAADWVLVTDNNEFLARKDIQEAAEKIKPNPKLRLWTDDYSSLLPLMRWQSSEPPQKDHK